MPITVKFVALSCNFDTNIFFIFLYFIRSNFVLDWKTIRIQQFYSYPIL